MKTTLLITTYNWPEALELVLKSLEAQTQKPDEVLIADDGSTEETRLLIENYSQKSTVPINHIFHEDEGFRRTVILNKALAAAKGDYIIQLDGDCIMHKHFVGDHAKNAEKNTYLFGSRVNIKEEALPELFSTGKVGFGFFDAKIYKRTRNLHIPIFSNFYNPKNELSRKLRGCNLSYWRDDIIKINGYNEDMTGWGKEDSEMAVRLLNMGVKGKRLRYRGIIYHIWHKSSSKQKEKTNTAIQQKAMDEKLKRCENGIDKYLD